MVRLLLGVGVVILIVVCSGRHGRTGGKHQEAGTAERCQEPQRSPSIRLQGID